MKLSLRLQTILEMIPQSVVADIGSDHGKLMIALFENGIISHGYAVENKTGPYNRLKRALEQAGLIDKIIPLLSDGISELPTNVTTVVVAGMGGTSIVDILCSHKEKLKNVSTIIIDAHSCLAKVREEISKLGYVIADERIIRDEDVFYEIIKFIKSDVAFYNDTELEFGPVLVREKSRLFKEKYQERISEINHLLEMNLPSNRLEELKQEKKKIEGIL